VAAEPAPIFEPIHQLRAHEYVADQIRRHIALRLVAPGESLPSERELAAMFGVGRPTIQHAMRLLEADSMVEARRGRGGGTFVSEPVEELIDRVVRGRAELEELIVYRRTIEPPTARLAAATRRRRDVTAMRAALRGMAEATAEADYMRHDTEFHLAIARATRNGLLARQAEDIRMGLNDAMTLLPESDRWHARIEREHEAIVAAIDRRDERAAEEAMDLHVEGSERALRAVLAAARRRAVR
jgi:GntR family transcriptional regulator, transcriptional repressor for pyruvate dehydrogenase complex